jgi:hypothetical protein
MSFKDLQGNDVSTAAKNKPVFIFLFVAAAIILLGVVFSYRVYDCINFNHRNRQRLRNLENYGAAATLRDHRRDWKYPWLVKDTAPVNLIFFDHPRFKSASVTDVEVTKIVRLIRGLPNVPSVHIARKNMSPEIVAQLQTQLSTIDITTEGK